ncbi:MAG: S-layer homology domain-containing protein [Clostridia bacterium]|nr:S-layer homology domain-containing protein [Clostridia bacterium]
MKKTMKSLVAAALAVVTALPSAAAVAIAVSEEPIAASPAVEVKVDDITTEELTAAILRYKEVFGETDRFEEFYHSYGTYQNLKMLYLDWQADNESVSASITETGLITSYTYNRTKTASGMIIPEISKNEALTTALGWVAKINPEYLSYVSDRFASVTYSRGIGRYNITLYANINGRKIADSFITLRISSDGTLLSYNCSTMPYNTKPAMDNGLRLIDEGTAAKKLAEALPFKLVYRSFYDYNSELRRSEAKVKLVYVPNEEYGSTVINAITGDTLKLVYPERDVMYGNGMYEDGAVTEETVAEAPAASDRLTEAELGAVEIQESFKTTTELKEMLLKLAVFDFDAGYELASSNVTKSYDSYTGEESYVRTSVWKKNAADGNGILRATLTCDAETGEIISFYRSNYSLYDYSQWKYSPDALAEKAASVFAKISSYSGEYKPGSYDYSDVTYRTAFSLQFSRYYQEIPVEADNAGLTLDPNTGLVLRYNINHIDAPLQSSSDAMTASAAADMYYSKLGLEPYYIVAGKLTDSELTYVANNIDSTEKLVVPVYNIEYYCFVDAITGQLVDYSYEEYTKPENAYFDRNSFAEDAGHRYESSIKLLYNMSYIDGASTFRPDDAITEEEFIDLANNVLGYYELGKNTASTITKTNAAKIIITALGHSEIASLKGIYKLPFEDSGSIAEEDVGYLAIACALGLFERIGDSFDPSATLTRGEAAAIMEAYILQQSSQN